MATATPPPSTNRADLQRKVADPLQRLRGYIRGYVVLEGLALVGIYLAAWFWLGLAIDWGFFKLFTIDWVQILPFGMRAAILSVLSAGLVALVGFKIGYRLKKEFRDGPLALVLERRFPAILGDRLITAIELADPRLSARYGYSQSMVDKTIEDAAHAVGTVPVTEVFHWKRLYRYGYAVLALTLGMVLLAAVAYFVVLGVSNSMAERRAAANQETAVTTPASLGDFAVRFSNAAVTWFERNILLRNVIWPRRAFLELVDFPASGEKCVGKNVPSTDIRVRALKYVIADPKSPEGWRPVKWNELTRELLGTPVAPFPAEWRGEPDMSVDQAETRLNKEGGVLPFVTVQSMRATLAALGQRGKSASMERRLRMLEVPAEVQISFRGESGHGGMTLKRENDTDYAGQFTDLKETIRFQATAEDYSTTPRTIRVEPPPILGKLEREQTEPAYTLQAPPSDGQGAADLKGLKQVLQPERVSLGGDKSIVQLTRGSDVTLNAVADKDLTDVKLVTRGEAVKPVEGQPALPAVPLPAVTLGADKRTISTHFVNVQRPLTFDFQFTDKDGITGTRQVALEPVADAPPRLKLALDPVIAHRKGPQGYLITPIAMVPFSGSAQDDHGLAKVQFHFTRIQLEDAGAATVRAEVASLFLTVAPGAPGFNPVAGLAMPSYFNGRATPTNDPKGAVQTATLPGFQNKLDEQARRAVTLATIKQRLKERAKPEPMILTHDFQPDVERFDLQKLLPTLLAPKTQAQPRYRLEAWVVATDNNVEAAKPGETSSDEQFNFLVVSEAELMEHLFREKSELQLIVEKKVKPSLVNAQVDLAQGIRFLTEKNADAKAIIDNEAVRTFKLGGILKTNKDLMEGVSKDAQRLLREMELNRFTPKSITETDSLCRLIEDAVNNHFVAAEAAMTDFHNVLDRDKRYDEVLGKRAGDKLAELIAQIDKIMDAFGDIVGFEKVRVDLQQLKREQEENHSRLKKWKDIIEDAAFGPKK